MGVRDSPSEGLRMECVGRWLYNLEGIAEGYLRFEDGVLEEVCLGAAPRESTRSVILPAFVNAHTHVGDSIAYPAPKGTVEEIVGPPDGYKHRVLKASPRDEKVSSMRTSIRTMGSTGTAAFIDFREEGVEGVKMVAEALDEGSPRAVVLGRPVGDGVLVNEMDALLKHCQGLGLSAVRDWPLDSLTKMCRITKSQGKLFALHASEALHEDLDRVLALHPDFLVHMTAATDRDLRRCAETDVPVVVCPRSNEFFGIRPDIPRMLRAGLTVALGTDNCMICSPDMLAELQAAYRLSIPKGGLTPAQTVQLATFGGRKVLNAEGKITTEIGVSDDLVAVDVGGADPLLEVVTTARSGDISAVIRGGRLRRP